MSLGITTARSPFDLFAGIFGSNIFAFPAENLSLFFPVPSAFYRRLSHYFENGTKTDRQSVGEQGFTMVRAEREAPPPPLG